ncbi:MAG: IS630 family transposase [Planctomycetia bacterium]|nr:IS630 family transposase [Planctomycetia bacterium]
MTSQRRVQYWVIPPKADAEFAAAMERTIETYQPPYNVEIPVVCMDEQPISLHANAAGRESIPETLNHCKRVDYEYIRNGTASIFMFVEPLTGLRWVDVRERRTKIDWALEVASILPHFPKAKKIILVSDNLNTHTYGAFYEAFPAAEASRFCRLIELRHTPKHGSWLNIAECELSVLTRQCLKDRRFPTLEILQSETRAWNVDRNERQTVVDWQFTTDDARTKLKSIYPQF